MAVLSVDLSAAVGSSWEAPCVFCMVCMVCMVIYVITIHGLRFPHCGIQRTDSSIRQLHCNIGNEVSASGRIVSVRCGSMCCRHGISRKMPSPSLKISIR